MPASRAIDATVSGLSPESTFSSTPWLWNHSTVACASGRSRSARRTSPCAWGRSSSSRSAVPNASTRRPSPAARPASASEASQVEVLGRAEHVPDAVDPLGAVAVPRRERHLLLDLGRVGGVGVRDRLERRVARRRGGRVAAELVGQRVGADEPDDAKRGLGERAGLVEADDVDRRERLDRVQLLDERAATRHAQRGDGVRQADEQHEPFGDERDDRRDGGRDRGVQRRVTVPERVAEHHRERHHQRHEDEQAAGSAPARAASADGGTCAPRP